MEVLITIIEFLAILGVVVVVHEFGHFATAKAFGIKVNEFGFGFPPRLLGFRKGETTYTLNLIPIGGFVKLEGENDPTQPRSFASKGVATRFIVLVAGVFMNVVLAVVLFSGFFMFTVTENEGPTGVTLQTSEELRIREVSPGSPADLAGVIPGDVILAVDGDTVNNFDDLVNNIDANRGTEIEWLLKRGDVEQPVRLVPRVDPPQGIRLDRYASHPWDAAARSIKLTLSVPKLLKEAIVNWVADDGETPFAGPVGIAQGTGEWAREFGLIALVPLAALLSVSLAILNILPIPALDGGRIVFVILEWIRRGKRIPPEKEGIVHVIGFACMMAFLVAITYNDIIRLVEGNSVLP